MYRFVSFFFSVFFSYQQPKHMLDYAIYFIKRNKKGLQIVFRLINNDISLQYGG